MIYFINDKKGNTIVDIEVWIKSSDGYSYVEISSYINIKNYSNILLSLNNNKNDFINDINELNDIRGWLWEEYQENSIDHYDDIINTVKSKIRHISKKWDLVYIED
jgi:hypothetical protein